MGRSTKDLAPNSVLSPSTSQPVNRCTRCYSPSPSPKPTTFGEATPLPTSLAADINHPSLMQAPIHLWFTTLCSVVNRGSVKQLLLLANSVRDTIAHLSASAWVAATLRLSSATRAMLASRCRRSASRRSMPAAASCRCDSRCSCCMKRTCALEQAPMRRATLSANAMLSRRADWASSARRRASRQHAAACRRTVSRRSSARVNKRRSCCSVKTDRARCWSRTQAAAARASSRASRRSRTVSRAASALAAASARRYSAATDCSEASQAAESANSLRDSRLNAPASSLRRRDPITVILLISSWLTCRYMLYYSLDFVEH